MARCKECGREIRYIRLYGGTYAPVDPEPLYWESSWGWYVIVTVDGRITQGSDRSRPGAVRGYRSHFETCPVSAPRKREHSQDG